MFALTFHSNIFLDLPGPLGDGSIDKIPWQQAKPEGGDAVETASLPEGMPRNIPVFSSRYNRAFSASWR